AQTVDGRCSPAADRRPVATSPAPGPPVTGGGDHFSSPPKQAAPHGLAPVRSRLVNMGLSEAAVNTIQHARAISTTMAYKGRWEAFETWCLERSQDPLVCPVSVVLNFVQSLLDKGLSLSTIRGYVFAISACHTGYGGSTVAAHPLVKRFIQGVRCLKPVAPPRVPQWDLTVVLKALCSPPFEPLESVEWRALSLKVALLTALVSAKRVSDLCALSVHPDCLSFSGSDRVVLRPNPAFTPKDHDDEEDAMLHKLCPVRALSIYVRRSQPIRQADQLFVCYGAAAKGKPVTAQRFSHWLTDAINWAYECMGLPPLSEVRAHSTRGMAASRALFKGVSVQDICTAASWSSPCAFVRFYLLDASTPSVAHAVLSSASNRTGTLAARLDCYYRIDDLPGPGEGPHHGASQQSSRDTRRTCILVEQDRSLDWGQASGSLPGSQTPHQDGGEGGSDPTVSSSEGGDITGSDAAPRGLSTRALHASCRRCGPVAPDVRGCHDRWKAICD
ncbi:uncharacterized protein LOC133142296, partial [Conger conger]|uniref:uncharacterized protein LOC133142296 n=1 Tax=Conger conger TaxID=82655 RepID=UPI002A59F8F1